MEITSRIVPIKRKIYSIYSLSVNAFVSLYIIKLEDVFIDYGRDIIIINSYNSLKVLLISTPKGENVLITSYSIKNKIIPL